MFNWQPRSRLANDERGRAGGGSALYVIPAVLGPLLVLGGIVVIVGGHYLEGGASVGGGAGVLYAGARLATM